MAARVLKGIVISAKAKKTIAVSVEQVVKHPKYHKSLRRSTKYQVHDELSQYKAGDEVMITECRPVSKTKAWKVVEG